MQIAEVSPNRTVSSGGLKGKFLRMCGQDALVELTDGRRIMWSGSTDVQILTDEQEAEENILPRLQTELARLESFTEGKYAQLGVAVETECILLPAMLHPPFVQAVIGDRPVDAVLCRRCLSRLCVRADHLFWGTRSDCQRDMILRGVAKPSGKSVTAVGVAAKIVKLRLRISRLTAK